MGVRDGARRERVVRRGGVGRGGAWAHLEVELSGLGDGWPVESGPVQAARVRTLRLLDFSSEIMVGT